MSETGLLLIVFGWVVQALASLKKDLKIKPLFLILYILGVLLLSVDGFQKDLLSLAVLNLLALAVAGFVFLKQQQKL